MDELGKKIDDLIRQLASRDLDVSISAKYTLVKIGSPAVPSLVDVLKDEDFYVRGSAAEVLGNIGNPTAVPTLIDALKDDPHVRDRAAEALLKIGISDEQFDTIIEILKNGELSVRKGVVIALGEIGDARAVPALIKALEEEAWGVRWNAVGALGKIKDARAVPALITKLKDKNESVWRSAAWALGEIIPSLTDIRLRETEGLLRKALEKAEGREKKNLFDVLDKINKKRNEILAPEAKNLKPPKILKRRKKPKRRGMWRAVQ